MFECVELVEGALGKEGNFDRVGIPSEMLAGEFADYFSVWFFSPFGHGVEKTDPPFEAGLLAPRVSTGLNGGSIDISRE